MIEDRIGSVRTGPQLFFSFQYSIPVLLSTPWPTKSLRNARSAPLPGLQGVAVWGAHTAWSTCVFVQVAPVMIPPL